MKNRTFLILKIIILIIILSGFYGYYLFKQYIIERDIELDERIVDKGFIMGR